MLYNVQAVVQNLMISRIEFRDDTDPDVAKHCHVRTREQRLVPVCQEGRLIRQLLRKLMMPLAMRLNTDAEVRVGVFKGHYNGIACCSSTRACTQTSMPTVTPGARTLMC
jgi:ERCC4-related helicase